MTRAEKIENKGQAGKYHDLRFTFLFSTYLSGLLHKKIKIFERSIINLWKPFTLLMNARHPFISIDV